VFSDHSIVFYLDPSNMLDSCIGDDEVMFGWTTFR